MSSEFEVISNSFEMNDMLFCSICGMVLDPVNCDSSIVIDNNLPYHTECFNCFSEEKNDNNEELDTLEFVDNIKRLPASLTGKKGRKLKVRKQRGKDPALIAQIENLNFDIFQRKSLFLTLNDVKTVTRQLGYLPYNIVEIGAYENNQFQDGIIDSRERISFNNDNSHHIRCDSLSNINAVPQVLILYPLNANDLQGRYNLEEGSKPFPTITWMSCPNLFSKISKLEVDGWIAKFQKKLTNVNEGKEEYRERMKVAHRLYSEFRWNLLTNEDKEMIEKAGWAQNLRDIGIAGMAKCDTVKCLHTHYAHFLAFPEHGNIIGEWVHELLVEERDKNSSNKFKKDRNSIQVDKDITELSVNINSLNINSEKEEEKESNIILTPGRNDIKDSSNIENNNTTPNSYLSPPSKVDYSSPPSKVVNPHVDVNNILPNAFSPRSSSLTRLDDNVEELKEAVLKAATETTSAFNCTDGENAAKLNIRKNILSSKLNETKLRNILKYNPSLCCYRSVIMGSNIGHTPMHICAGNSNIKAMEILIEFGASTWVRDLQGRTPLHIAAEKNQIVACEFLRNKMMLERKDPIGEDAPTDLKGTTPLGCASISTKGKASPALRKLLFNVGDNSVFPRSPRSPRAGKSPWKGPLGTITENLIYAHAETNGWKESMEDRISISNPVIGRTAWSFFGIFDGHGGQYTANFVADKFPIILSNEANLNEAKRNNHDFSSLLGGKDNDEDTTPEILKEILLNTCKNVDEKLSKEDRMLIEFNEKKAPYKDIHSKNHKYFTSYDTSGSAAIIALVTSRYVAIGNIGDSRAVLGHRISLEKAPTSIYPNHHNLVATDLSRDHKLNIPEEQQRAEDAGCIVNDVEGCSLFNKEVHSICYTDTCRLRMSRSFGDFYLKQNIHLPYDKQAVTAVPEIRIHDRTSW
jgi:serine/threonine protein phosphatase PrpC